MTLIDLVILGSLLAIVLVFVAWVYYSRYNDGYITGWLDCLEFMERDIAGSDEDLWDDDGWDDIWSIDDAVLADWMYDDGGEEVYDQEKDRGKE